METIIKNVTSVKYSVSKTHQFTGNVGEWTKISPIKNNNEKNVAEEKTNMYKSNIPFLYAVNCLPLFTKK